MTAEEYPGRITPGQLEGIIMNNKAIAQDCSSLLAALPKDERDETIENAFRTMIGYGFPQTRFGDLLCLHAYLPNHIDEVVMISQKIEGIAKRQGIKFKDVVLSLLEDEGVPLGYSKDCSDFKYLVNAVYIIGGLTCVKNHDYFCEQAKKNRLPENNDDRKDIIISHGLKSIDEALAMERDVSEELNDELMGELPMPIHGYTNLASLKMSEDLDLPRKYR